VAAAAAAKNPEAPKPKTRPAMRRLTDEELTRAFAGMPIRPLRTVTATYFTGLKKTKSISHAKALLRDQCDVQMKNILNIDFIGKSLVEIHLYADYLETFKGKLLDRKCLQIEFLNVNPLDDGLLRYAVAENKALEAARKYHHRLARRLEQTPITAHKKFLREELAKAEHAIETHSNAMNISAPLTANDAPSSVLAACAPNDQ
jgi:hypothetical protein